MHLPHKQILKKMNYVSDQRGIINRYINEKSTWDTHLLRTKQFIINSLTDKKINSLTILGSGWLLDIPINYLHKDLKNIYLLDIIHPIQIIHKLKNYKNIQLISTDITGGYIQHIYDIVLEHKARKSKRSLIRPDITPSFKKWEGDYIVSLNVLNQLDILLVDYIAKYGIYTEDEILKFRTHIQKQHIDLLPKGRSCLITDYEEILIDQNQNKYNNPSIFISLPPAIKKEEWIWCFDSSMTYHQDKKTIFKVVALEL